MKKGSIEVERTEDLLLVDGLMGLFVENVLEFTVFLLALPGICEFTASEVVYKFLLAVGFSVEQDVFRTAVAAAVVLFEVLEFLPPLVGLGDVPIEFICVDVFNDFVSSRGDFVAFFDAFVDDFPRG